MRSGLVGRIVVAGAVVVAFLLAEFALVVLSFHDLRADRRALTRSQQEIALADSIERDLARLAAAQRGFAISGERSFLASGAAARRNLPGEIAALRSDESQEPNSRGRSVALQRQYRAYVRDWVRPIDALVTTDPPAALRRIASGEGDRRRATMRQLVERLVGDERAGIAAARRRVSRAESRGVLVGVGGIAVTVLLFAGIVAYFLRVAIAPLRRIAAATERVAAGELETTVREEGSGEVRELSRAFNVMTASLRGGRDRTRIQRERLRAVLNATPDGICLTDLDGNVLLANLPLAEMTVDVLKLPLEGTIYERLLAGAERTTDPDAFRRYVEEIRADPAGESSAEYGLVDAARSFRGYVGPVRHDDGTLVGRIFVLHETTAERAADRAKDEFVATVSHELRTPLTSIVGFLEMLLEEDAGPLTDEQRRFLEIVERSSQRLMRQVADLLFIAQLDSAGLALKPEPAPLGGLVADCAEAVGALARTREIDLRVDVGAAPEARVDRERITQVTSNLLSNALKFTPTGGRVDVRAFAEDGVAVIEVEDTGIGVPEAERGRLFERFFRSSATTAHAVQGTGLGLAISKAIVEAHGGTIAAFPGAERGTRVRVELPL